MLLQERSLLLPVQSKKYWIMTMILHLLEIIWKILFLLPALLLYYLLPLALSSFYYQHRIYLLVFSFIICSYLLLSEFMRPLRPVQSSLTITRLIMKLINE